jgi:hypothetical protein
LLLSLLTTGASAKDAFVDINFVYEPSKSSEIHYWCEKTG